MATNPHRFGNSAYFGTYIDLPFAQGDISTSWIIPGGSARSRNGTLLTHWVGTPKVRYEMTFKPWAQDSVWREFQRLLRFGPGPFELYDPIESPNLLSMDDRLGVGWVTSTGTAVAAQSNMRMAISASPSSVQTAISSAPAAANLTPVVPGTQYTAAITVEASASYNGSFACYGYTATPSGSGTLQATVSTVGNGRFTITFTPGVGIVYVELRATRGLGSANLVDATVYPSSIYDPGPGIRKVMMPLDSWHAVTHFVGSASGQSNRTTITVALEEV